MNGEPSPQLQTERLVLRRPEISDAERMAAMADHMEIARNLTARFPHPYTVDDARDFIENAPEYKFVIEPVEPVDELGPGLVGGIGGSWLSEDPQSEAEGVHQFGYWLTPAAWGQGFATEAGRAYVDHVIDALRPRRIEASAYGWNPKSGRVLEKLGLKFEGRQRDAIKRFGEVTDLLMYGLSLVDHNPTAATRVRPDRRTI